MRVSCALGMALCVFLAPDRAWAQPAACGPQAIGVSRTVEIDTRTAPRFGFQYNDAGFLADGEIVLTFDDGPLRAYTRSILETLASQRGVSSVRLHRCKKSIGTRVRSPRSGPARATHALRCGS